MKRLGDATRKCVEAHELGKPKGILRLYFTLVPRKIPESMDWEVFCTKNILILKYQISKRGKIEIFVTAVPLKECLGSV